MLTEYNELEKKCPASPLSLGAAMPELCEPDNPQWLTPEQVSKRLGVSVEVLAASRSRGNGPHWLQIGAEVRYDEADLLHWME